MDMHKPHPSLSGQSQENFMRKSKQQTLPALPQYEVPSMVSYTDQDILEKLGPALTGTGSRIF